MLHNLEVLPKDITPDALIKLMKDWNASLNVDCVFCHKGQVGKPWSTYDFTDTTQEAARSGPPDGEVHDRPQRSRSRTSARPTSRSR